MKKDIISRIKKVLQKEGFRFTKQRKAVWKELENSDDHHDADKIYENIKSKDVSVSRACLLYTSPSPRDLRLSRMPSSA